MLFVALLSSPGALACAAEPEVLVLDVQHRGSSGYQETAPKSLTAARERASELARCGKKFVIDRARPADAVLNKVVVKVNADGEVTEVIRPSRNPGDASTCLRGIVRHWKQLPDSGTLTDRAASPRSATRSFAPCWPTPA